MSDATITTSPWTEMVSNFSSKTIIGSRLRSDEWAGVPVALREEAMFSSTVEDLRVLSAMREKILQGLEQARPGGTGMDGARFAADLRNLMGAAPGDSGDLTDITSTRRLSLIWNFQVASANAKAAYKADLDPNLLDAFPGYRLIRVESRRVPRDWYERWGEAGAAVGWEGASKTELIALKTSPIWTALSRFGRPTPPFDFQSGMGWEDIDRAEAEALGLLPKNQSPAARLQMLRDASAKQQQDWNEGLQASVKGLNDEARGWLKDAFGDQVSIDGDTAEWNSQAVQDGIEATPAPLWRNLTDSVPDSVPPELSDQAAVEVTAVEAGTKPVYHEQVGDELAGPMTAWLRSKTGDSMDIWTREGHVFARRFDSPFSRKEIETRLIGGAGGELLGYGAETMFAPGNVPVAIFDENHKVVAGFFAPADSADQIAQQRVADWVAATGKKFFYEVKR
jgi:hypothetical protein